MRFPSGVTDQYIYFVAVDVTDLKTRETGLSGFTVYRSRNGGAAAAFTTPTVNETDVTNMPGVYELLLDEDMTIDAGDDSQEFCLHITHASMSPVTRVFELYRPKATAGETIGVSSGAVSNVTTTATATAVTTVNGLAANVITATSIADGAIDAATFAAGAITATVIATGAIDADSLAADAGTEIGTAVWATGTRVLTASTNLGDLDDAVLAILGTPAGVSLAADIAAIEAQTDDIGAAGVGLTAIPWNAAWDAEVQSEVADALAVYDPPTNAEMEARTLVAASYATAAALTTVDDFLDSEVAAILTDTNAIKVQTDKLTFTVANQLDANVQSVNDTALTGDGGVTPWGPA
jgi:hypothetical protein